MEGLVKGLASVALDLIQGGDDGDERNDRPRSSRTQDDRGQMEERSRSSWAQVVSGEGDDHDEPTPNDNYNAGDWNNRPDGRHPAAQKESHRRNDEWNSRKSPHAEEAKNNDGWEVVGKKHPKPQHKVYRDQWSNYKRPPSEQEYSNEVEAYTEPSELELSDLSEALNRLWELDVNRLVPGKDYEIDCGEGKKVYQKEDMADGSLFSWLSEDIFRRPTYSRFCSLLDNYNPHQGQKEVVTSEEKQEQVAFIEEISRTAPIKYLKSYLVAKGIVSGNHEEFKRMMISFWFDLFGRGGTSSCSSAFEHVFVGEIKRGDQEVSGFHNWIQFYLEEVKGRVDYQGYIFPRRRGQIPDSETQLLTIQFEWNGVLKSVSSTLIGVSPEFEIAVYTLCFFLGDEDNRVQLGPYPVNIKCYRLGNKIGSAFPVAES